MVHVHAVANNTYGSVIVHIDADMIESVPVPVVDEETKRQIGELVLQANALRNEAWEKEQEAIHQVEQMIKGY